MSDGGGGLLERCVAMLEERLELVFARTSSDASLSDAAFVNREVIRSVGAAIANLDPPPARVVVVTKDDADLLAAAGHNASSFPQSDDGVYAGYYPEDDTACIDHLNLLSARGADYLVFPGAAIWWLDHYPDFSRYLNENFVRTVPLDGMCVIYRLATPRSEWTVDLAVDCRNSSSLEARLQRLCAVALELDRELGVLFDREFYLAAYPDVHAAGVEPLFHYLLTGADEGRDPNPLFDTEFYLEHSRDVADSNVNPLLHFLVHGAEEERAPNARFDSGLYRQDHADTLTDTANPLAHFLACEQVAAVVRSALLGASFRWTRLTKQLIQSICEHTRHRVMLHPHISAPSQNGQGVGRGPTSEPLGGVLVVSHDALSYGAQLIALSVVGELTTSYTSRVIVLLKRGGPLVADFQKLAPTVVLEGVELSQSSAEFDSLLATVKALGVEAAICNTMVTGDVAERLKANDLVVVSAIHELPGAVVAYGTPQLLRQSLRSSDHVVFPAQFVRERLEDAFGEQPRSGWVRPQGIPRPNPFLDERAFARLQVSKQCNIPDDATIVLGCGLASQRKGFDLFVVVARLVLARAGSSVHFVWVGSTVDPFVNAGLRDIQMAGLGEVVHVAGAQDHAGLFFAASDIFALTSREDPLPTVGLEAMEAALPVVAFDRAGGLGEILTADAGVLVPYLDVVAMADAIVSLAQDPGRRVTTGACGRALVAGLTVSAYTAFLLDLIALPEPSPRA